MASEGQKKARGLQRYSKDGALAWLDRRTREGKFAAAVEHELLEHCGVPSPCQRIICRLASIKALRVAMMSDWVLSAEIERDDRQFLAWSTSLRRDLESLGLSTPRSQLPSLSEYIGLDAKAA